MRNLFNSIFIILFISPYLYSQKSKVNYITSYFKYLEAAQAEKSLNYSKALFLYNEAIKIYKEYPEPYYRIAIIYKEKGEYRKAKEYFKQAEKYEKKFRNKSDYINYLLYAAEIYYKLKDYNNALNFYTKLYKTKKKPEIIYKIGELYYLVKDKQNSKKYMEELLTEYLNRDNELRESKKADKKLRKTLQILVNINMDNSEYHKALKYLKILYKHFPDKEIKNKVSILSNNLRYYDKK